MLQNKRVEGEEKASGFKEQDNILTTGLLTRVYYCLIDLHMHFVQEDFSAAGDDMPAESGEREEGRALCKCLKMIELIVRFHSSCLAHGQKAR